MKKPNAKQVLRFLSKRKIPIEASAVIALLATLKASLLDIRGLINVLQNFVAVGDYLSVLANENDREVLARAQITAKKLLSCKKELASGVRGIYIEQKIEEAYLHGLCGEFHEYTVMFHESSYDHPAYGHLLAHGFLILRPTMDFSPGQRIVWSRAVRALGEKKSTYLYILDQLPDTACDLATFSQCFTHAVIQMEKALVDHHIDNVRIMLKKGVGAELERSRKKSAHGHHAGSSFSWKMRGARRSPLLVDEWHVLDGAFEEACKDIDPEIPIPKHLSITPPPPPLDLEVLLKKNGLEPAELAEQFNVEVAEDARRLTTGCYDTRDYENRCRYSADARARANTLVPLSVQELADDDIHYLFLDVINTLTVCDALTNKGKQQSLALGSIVELIFLVGRPEEDVIKLTVTNAHPSAYQPLKELTYIPDKKVLVVPAELAQHRIRRKNGEEKAARQIVHNMALPLPQETAQRLDVLLLASNIRVGDKAKPVFNKALRGVSVSKVLGQLLRNTNQRRGTELTLARIRDCWSYKMAGAMGSGRIIAALLTTHPIHAIRTTVTYTNLSVYILRAAYIDTMNTLIVSLPLGLSELVEDSPREEDEDHYVGSRIVPADDTVKALSGACFKAVADGKRQIYQLGIAPYHNAYVTHIGMLLNYAMANRAVSSLLPNGTDINSQHGLVVVSDKDKNDYRNARGLSVSPAALRQFIDYKKHLCSLSRKFDFLPDEDIEVGNNRSIITIPDLKRDTNRAKSNKPLFFRFYDNGIEEAGPKDMQLPFDDIYPMHTNSHRHYMLSKLIEQNLPEHFVRDFAGHRSPGADPASKYSRLSIGLTRDVMAPLIDEILKNAGWIQGDKPNA